MIMVAGNSVKNFFSYVEEKRQYFGNDYLTIQSLIVLALNYDVSNNFVATYVRNFLKGKDLSECNKMIFDYCTRFKFDESKLELFEDEAFDVSILCEAKLAKRLSKISDNLAIDKESIEENNYKVMDFEKFLYELIMSYDRDINNGKVTKDVFGKIGFNYKEFIKEFRKHIYAKEFVLANDEEYDVIPDDLKKFVSFIDGAKEEYNVNYENINIQADFSWLELQKRKDSKLVLVGEQMSGKKPTIMKMANQLHKGKIPVFKGYKIVKLDCCDLLKAEVDEEYIELVMQDFYDFIEGKDYIIFVDNLYIVREDTVIAKTLWQMLWPLFLDEEYYTISALTLSTADIFNHNLKFLKKITLLTCAEPKREEEKEALRETIFLLTFYHGVYVTDEMLDKAILYATTFGSSEAGLFGYEKEILDVCMVIAKMFGKAYLTEEDLKYNFLPLFKEYKKYTKENKRNTALHEAGHFVARRFSKHFTAQRVKLISVIPHNDALGYNLLDYDPTRIKSSGYEYYLEKICFAVAGRAAEELFSGGVTDGASGDLEYASEIAKYMVAYLSLDKSEDGKIRIKVNENLKSNESLNKVDEKANKIINKAYEMALIILKRHEDYVLGLADLLEEKMIVSDKDIQEHEMDALMEVALPYKKIGKKIYYANKMINTKIWKA